MATDNNTAAENAAKAVEGSAVKADQNPQRLTVLQWVTSQLIKLLTTRKSP